jgi:hypothetical protein
MAREYCITREASRGVDRIGGRSLWQLDRDVTVALSVEVGYRPTAFLWNVERLA